MADRPDSMAYSTASFPTSSYSSDDCDYVVPKTVEGFDYEFVPKPDSKYECVICLLVLREPQQTKCGHRFCKACITKWLREANKSCPVDNDKIQESDLFADNFVKREIQNFNVKCPNNNHGCDEVVMLKFIQRHVDECPLGLIPCPNHCSNILLRRDLTSHLTSVCGKRQVLCEFCKECVTFERLPAHYNQCPNVLVKCSYCDKDLTRGQIKQHENTECEQAVVHCSFQPLGCLHVTKRCDMKDHMKSSIPEHLDMLCGKVLQISRCLGIAPGRYLGSMADVEELASSMHATQVSEEILQNVVPILNRLSMTQGDLNTSVKPVDMFPSTGSEEGVLSYSSRQSMPDNSASLSSISSKSESLERGFKSLKTQNALQDESLARHTQELALLQDRTKGQEKVIRDLKLKVKSLENTVSEFDSRSCNGIYIWKIRDYCKLKQEAKQGETTAIHSPPFYSSYYGYKLCVRVNLNGVENAKDVCLSVFIHFLQGEYDDILEWPFNGRIILSVLDQNEVSEFRRPIVETLMAKPNLAAFQKPSTPRNHKGFGYMEFVPLNVLESGHFIKNDTLIIKANVIPNG